MGRKKEWIWEMQGEIIVADAASSRYRGMISIEFLYQKREDEQAICLHHE